MGDGARRHRLPGLPILDLGPPLQRTVTFPGAVGARLAAGMAELDARNRGLLPDESDQPLQGSMKASSQMPRSPMVPQPRRSTLVDSTTTRPAPPAANLPAFIRCQSVGK